MDKQKLDQSMLLTFSADMEYALVARMALSGFGMLAGLDVDLIEDLRTVTDEALDCLLHQMVSLKELQISAKIVEQRMHCRFCAVRGEKRQNEPRTDIDITRCILETLVPYVELHCDEDGVCCIEFSLAV